jgi:mannose-6-phosphate isomerase-like protein (cupin superfamily)
MTAYSKVNLDALEDFAPKFGFGEIQEARFATKPLDCEQTGLGYVRVKAGKHGFPHHHEEQEELYVVLRGSGTAILDDERIALAQHDVIRVAPETTRAFEAGDDGLDVIAFGAPAVSDGENDAVMERDAAQA